MSQDELSHSIHVTDRAITCHDKEMKNVIELLQVTVLELVRVSHDDSVYKSFKLTVYPEDYKKIYDPHLWPAGVCIRKYRLPNSIPESKAD